MKTNREIKFRCWDGISERFLMATELSDCIIRECGNQQGMTLKPAIYNSLEEKTLMQYTGLKDKNGKEIYEGDIVVRVSAPKPEPKVVEYNVNTCGYSGIRRTSRYELEIIGNIYENGDLLK